MERLFQPGLLTGLFLLIFSPLSSASELAHGPLTLPGGDGEQLSFYRDAEQVLAQVQDDKAVKRWIASRQQLRSSPSFIRISMVMSSAKSW